MKIARVFPRRTKATPDDELVFTTPPPEKLPEIDEVHVSVAFTYDMAKAETLYEAWSKTGLPVKIGGPALNEPGGDFVPGLYLKKGHILTSRGCRNRCWFCSVPKREGYTLRELPITEGWIVGDDNLLGCTDNHILKVFDMLKKQEEKPIFTGGLEARLLKPWHVDLLRESRAKRIYFANDMPGDLEPLIEAGKLLRDGGISRASDRAYCYVLIGYDGDSMDAAEKRLHDTFRAGFMPYAMLYRDNDGIVDNDWKSFQRLWVRPAIIYRRMKEVGLQ